MKYSLFLHFCKILFVSGELNDCTQLIFDLKSQEAGKDRYLCSPWVAVGVTSWKQKPIAPRLSQKNAALASVRRKSKAMVAGGFCSAASSHKNLPFVHWTKARADGERPVIKSMWCFSCSQIQLTVTV